MEVYEMNEKLREELVQRLKSKNPTWLKWRWFYYTLCLLALCAFIVIAILVFDGAFDLEYFEILAMFALTGAIFVIIPLATLKLILITPALFPKYGGEVKISFQETGLLFWRSQIHWDSDSAYQYNEEIRIIMNYSAIRYITYNNTFERLEVYGDFQHQRRNSNWYNGKTGHLREWSEWKDDKEADCYVRNKGEKILHIYNYFNQMQELMSTLERVSGQVIKYTT